MKYILAIKIISADIPRYLLTSNPKAISDFFNSYFFLIVDKTILKSNISFLHKHFPDYLKNI